MIRRTVHAIQLALLAACAAVVGQAQPREPLIAVLNHGDESTGRSRVASLREGLRDLGYVDGRNSRIEVRWSENRIDRLPALAKELVALKPDVVVASLVRPAEALRRETKTIPIVMAGGAGADNLGLIASLARPGGYVTGLTNQGDDLTAKPLELLREIAPGARRVVTLSSGLGAVEGEIRADSREAAKRYGMELIEALADSPARLSLLRARCAAERCGALVALLDPNLSNFRKDIIALAAELRIPAVYSVNQAAAKAIGIKVPQSILVRADRVIE